MGCESAPMQSDAMIENTGSESPSQQNRRFFPTNVQIVLTANYQPPDDRI